MPPGWWARVSVLNDALWDMERVLWDLWDWCIGSSPVSFITMMTSSNGNIFRVTGPLCGKSTGPGDFPTQRPVTRSFDVFFDLHLNKRLSKQPWGWWFEPPSWSLWRQCNDTDNNPVLSDLSTNVDRYQGTKLITDVIYILSSTYVSYVFRVRYQKLCHGR